MSISICGSPPIFLDNKYTVWYVRFMARAQLDPSPVYVTKHHIWPKGTGGPNKTPYLAKLTYKEHFIAHHLLIKMTEGIHKRNMCNSLGWFLIDYEDPNRKLTARQYEIARKALKVYLQFYILDGDEYSVQPDFYRFCDEHRIGRANVQAKMKNGMHAILAGKHKGKVFSPTDVGAEAMKAFREQALIKTHKNRAEAVAQIHAAEHATDNNRRTRKTEIELTDPNGKLHKFNLLTDAAKIGPSGSLQNVKNKLPHTFTNGAWANWTLTKFCTTMR